MLGSLGRICRRLVLIVAIIRLRLWSWFRWLRHRLPQLLERAFASRLIDGRDLVRRALGRYRIKRLYVDLDEASAGVRRRGPKSQSPRVTNWTTGTPE
jgi:hypothetical protein